MIEINTKKFTLVRNPDGSLPAQDIKAIAWYMIRNVLKPMATNAWPVYEFRNREGEIVRVDLADIKAEYKEFRDQEKRKRKVAAS